MTSDVRIGTIVAISRSAIIFLRILLKNVFTLRFTIITVIASNILAFGLALLLSKPLKLRNLMCTIFFMPNVIGGILLGFIWQFIFTKGFPALGSLTGIPFFQLPWLGTAET